MQSRQVFSPWWRQVWFVYRWLRNIGIAVWTVAHGLWVTLRYWFSTYRKDRGAFTQRFEYPEKPVAVAARYRGFHRYAGERCAPT